SSSIDRPSRGVRESIAQIRKNARCRRPRDFIRNRTTRVLLSSAHRDLAGPGQGGGLMRGKIAVRVPRTPAPSPSEAGPGGAISRVRRCCPPARIRAEADRQSGQARARSCRGWLAASLGGRSISLLAATPAFIFFSLLTQLITFLGREPLAGADLGSEKSRSGVVGRGSSQTGEGPDFVEHAHR